MQDINVKITLDPKSISTYVVKAEFVLGPGDGLWKEAIYPVADQLARQLFGTTSTLFAYTDGNIRCYQRQLPHGWSQLSAIK
jgi:hypothetical protein